MPRRVQFMTWRTRKQRKRRGHEKEKRRNAHALAAQRRK